MRCPKCKTDNPDESVFCAKCGTQIKETEEKPIHTQTLEAPKEELTTGSTFAERYQIVEELGRGGMGNQVMVTNLKPNTLYEVRVYEFNLEGNKPLYLLGGCAAATVKTQ